MKRQKIMFLLLLLVLPACSGFYSEYHDVTPTVVPSSTSIISSSSASTTTPSISPTKTCELPTVFKSSETSPNGEWLVVNCKDSKKDEVVYIHIFNNYDSRNWKINYTDFKSDILFELDGGLHSPFYWSKNGESLFFEKHEQLNDGSAHLMGNVIRIDLVTGQAYDIFSEFDEIGYTFSPDDDFLIYATPHIKSNKIYVLSLENQEVKTIEWNEVYLSISPFGLWSNDNQNFVATLANTSGVNSLIVINVAEITQRTLFSNPPDLLFPLEWKNQDEVMVTNSLFYNRFPEAKLWLVNIRSREILKIR
jgi:hypothetical protein